MLVVALAACGQSTMDDDMAANGEGTDGDDVSTETSDDPDEPPPATTLGATATDGGDTGDGDPGGSDGESDGGDPSGSDGSEDTGEALHVDLFGCGLPLSCPRLEEHLEPPPIEDRRCAFPLALDGEPGVVQYSQVLGGGPPSSFDWLYFFIGDGTVVVQGRTPDGTLGSHELCEVSVEPTTAVVPEWTGACEEVPDYSCEELRLMLDL